MACRLLQQKQAERGSNVVTVKYDELSEAFDFVSFAGPMEHQAYIDRTTGKIYWVSEAVEDELPEDFDESDRYIAIPHKNDLDLGASLVLRFASESLPDQYGRIEGFFRKRGAYARFKELLAAQGRLEQWYAFELKCTEMALKRWCEENDVTIIDADQSA